VATQFSLTAAASRDIKAVLRRSSRTFGSVQRRVYETLIRRALNRIAENPLCLGSKSCEELGSGFRSFHVARVAVRQGAAAHVIYYSAVKIGENWSVTVIRVLHGRMDPELHITRDPT
jgi:plasmid stabilization system protein ParE